MGDPGRVRDVAAALEERGRALSRVGDRLAGLVSGEWRDTVVAFQVYFADEPSRWTVAGQAHLAASRALRTYADQLEAAQSAASRVIRRWGSEEHTTTDGHALAALVVRDLVTAARTRLADLGWLAAAAIDDAVALAPQQRRFATQPITTAPGPARTPVSFLDAFSDTILDAARRFGIDPAVLAALLIEEGQGRMAAGNGGFDAFRSAEAQGLAGATVGIGGLRPAVAAELATAYFDQDMTEVEARQVLAFDDGAAIYLAAAQLHRLKDRHRLTDEQAYTAYAGENGLIDVWKRGDTTFPGYDTLSDRASGFPERHQQANQIWGLAHPNPHWRPPANPVTRPGPAQRQ